MDDWHCYIQQRTFQGSGTVLLFVWDTFSCLVKIPGQKQFKRGFILARSLRGCSPSWQQEHEAACLPLGRPREKSVWMWCGSINPYGISQKPTLQLGPASWSLRSLSDASSSNHSCISVPFCLSTFCSVLRQQEGPCHPPRFDSRLSNLQNYEEHFFKC